MKILSYDEFSKKIKYNDKLTGVLGGLAVITLLLVGYNLFSTIVAIFQYSIPVQYWVELFFSTEGSDDKASVWLAIYVYGIVILTPALILVWIIDYLTKEKRIRKLFEIYKNNGEDVTLAPSLLMVKFNGKKERPLQIGDKTKVGAEAIIQQINSMIKTMDKKELKQLQKKALKLNFTRHANLVSIEKLFPEFSFNDEFAFGYLSLKDSAENAVVCTFPNGHRRLYFLKAS